MCIIQHSLRANNTHDPSQWGVIIYQCYWQGAAPGAEGEAAREDVRRCHRGRRGRRRQRPQASPPNSHS